ncbi:MAG: redox-sensing transcriptional repressor Rex [Candidatus Brocadiia bacterium]|nr:MAG: redox-sensing transcriptional repressor Rex [Candidatus Brocadiia bacterium]
MRYHKIPDEAIRRLPVYLRCVFLLSGKGHQEVSSDTLSEFLGIKSWQIRKDFSYFGDFGRPGVGYDTAKLQKQLSRILRLDRVHKAALVGVGNLGSAILAFRGFSRYNLKIDAAFDSDPHKIGKKRSGVIVENVSTIDSLNKRGIDLGIIAVPEEAAQKAAEDLIKGGVRGILNFSSQHIVAPKKVKIRNIDIAMDLASLPYYMPA